MKKKESYLTCWSTFNTYSFCIPFLHYSASGKKIDFILKFYVRQWRNLESEKEEDKEQELCNAIINILFTIMWKGYDAHQKLVWKVNTKNFIILRSYPAGVRS